MLKASAEQKSNKWRRLTLVLSRWPKSLQKSSMKRTKILKRFKDWEIKDRKIWRMKIKGAMTCKIIFRKWHSMKVRLEGVWWMKNSETTTLGQFHQAATQDHSSPLDNLPNKNMAMKKYLWIQVGMFKCKIKRLIAGSWTRFYTIQILVKRWQTLDKKILI